MTQKDKVKELVGRSLGSYHAKSLQQIDRIERKNKEQNHKISMLTNELDNDYLTKTEEGSVISLEHSKEGMIYLDELQGNTLVNYCTDGAKELTLNGDIDVEGTNVTLTEGVDNGKVDVICEGNTLINTIGKFKSNGGSPIITDEYIQLSRGSGDTIISNGIIWKPNTVYTFVYTILETNFTNGNGLTLSQNSKIINTQYIHGTTVGTHKTTFTTKDDSSITTNGLVILISSVQSSDKYIKLKDIYVLEGDWRNKEIPPYFEGMKSVGQDDENGHKIEITSQTGNLYNADEHLYKYSMSTDDLLWGFSSVGNRRSIKVPCKPNTTYTLSKTGGDRMIICSHNEDFNANTQVTMKYCYYNSANNGHIESYTFTTHSDSKVICAYVSIDNLATNIHLEELPNKKEISLNEPLRALPNGVKDKIVKIGGKYYVERNCGEVVLDGVTNLASANAGIINNLTNTYPALYNPIGRLASKKGISDRFEVVESYTQDEKGIYWGLGVNILIPKSELSSLDVDGVNLWFKKNPTTLIYQLETPTYEELPIDPTINTYTDITHISNNSTIPCNMKIQNTGYNAIIKPSTQYTVALDTNKSGTIGINLGGAKVTTTNNVATITTPATLTDDSLRLYGKGIKGSKVRLLEGDKTNWIPSHFEGMKSSFEDKLQEDGTFKMEILSNNKNLLDVDKNIEFDRMTIFLDKPLEKGVYSISYEKLSGYKEGKEIVVAFHDNLKTITYFYLNRTSTFNLSGKVERIHFYSNGYDWQNSQNNFVTIDKLQIEKGTSATNYEKRKQNKIQFSSIEPLRGVGDVQDKFVFKDGKLYLERNIKSYICDENSKWLTSSGKGEDGSFAYYVRFTDAKKISGLYGDFIVSNKAYGYKDKYCRVINIDDNTNVGLYCYTFDTIDDFKQNLKTNPIVVSYALKEPTYEEIPFELQKIILEGYENGTLFFDTNIPPTVTTTYAGETPIVKATKLNKTEVLNNSNDINNNIVPYLMDMDYRVVCLQLEGGIENVSMARLFGGTFEMLQRDILSNRYSKEEYKHRLDAYLSANKITHEEYTKLGDRLND